MILDYHGEENHPRTPPPHPETLSKFECGVQFMSVLNKTLVLSRRRRGSIHGATNHTWSVCVCRRSIIDRGLGVNEDPWPAG